MVDFDPNGIANGDGIFGMPYTTKSAKVIILPVLWDVTTSYRPGTSRAPKAIFDASPQLDFYDDEIKDAHKIGIAIRKINMSAKAQNINDQLRKVAEQYISGLENGLTPNEDEEMSRFLSIINTACEEKVKAVKTQASKYLDQKKIVGVLGGDHSTPLGLMQALAERNNEFGILHVDAHMDLRKAYEGFTYSHASIMYNALQIPQISKLVQIGVRDFCEEEAQRVKESNYRIRSITDLEAFEHKKEWKGLCKKVVNLLPLNVYVSFDIDGLRPELCPNTGTPVPGGLEYNEAITLLSTLVESGRKIIGYDLNEVGPQEWDANVGARVLYKMSNLAALSQGKAKRQEPKLKVFY